MKLADEKVVLFVDILGFAALTEKFPVDVDELSSLDRPASRFESILNGKEKNGLASAFWHFHWALKWALETARMAHPVTAISFSDSAFVAIDGLHNALQFGIQLTQSLLRSSVPVRTGIAHGSFAAVRFKSDIALDSGEHAAHFLGTGVVGAHVAESCGLKGVRILLHPSVVPLLSNLEHGTGPVLDLPEHERQNRGGVLHEVDYWSLNVTDTATAWRALQDMWAVAPDSEQVHYQATAEAINRMRVRQGYRPLEKLRRRTLPRK